MCYHHWVATLTVEIPMSFGHTWAIKRHVVEPELSFPKLSPDIVFGYDSIEGPSKLATEGCIANPNGFLGNDPRPKL